MKTEITFDGPGKYGVYDGFFNAIAIIDGEEYDFQCCAEDGVDIDFSDCGYDWGICGDANDKIFKKIGQEKTLKLLKCAYEDFKALSYD